MCIHAVGFLISILVAYMPFFSTPRFHLAKNIEQRTTILHISLLLSSSLCSVREAQIESNGLASVRDAFNLVMVNY